MATIAAAAWLGAAAPSAAAPAAGITSAGTLVTFDTAAPDRMVGRSISGLGPAETIRALDVRPAGGILYGLSVAPGATDTGRIYTIDPGSGAATRVGSAPFSTALTAGSSYGMDFNPVADRMRVVSSADQNLRVHPDTGALVATDANLNDPADTEMVAGSAYDRNTAGADATTLFGIDFDNDTLVRQGGIDGTPTPNGGVLTTIGPLGFAVPDGAVGFDIEPSGTAFLTATDASGGTPRLYTVNLTSGKATAVGTLASPLRAFAVLQESPLRFSASGYSVPEAAGAATVTVARSGAAAGTVRVDYATSDGTAAAGVDYHEGSGTLVFGPGVTTRTFAVPLIGDGADEADEAFTVTLAAPESGGALGSPSAATVTIADDDPAPPAPPDEVPPRVLLSLDPPARAARLATVAGAFSCSEACNAVLELRLRSTLIGTGSAALTEAGVRRFRVTLTARGRRLVRREVRRSRTARLTLRIRLTDAAGNTTTVPRRVTVRR